jgi:hypothetical protein
MTSCVERRLDKLKAKLPTFEEWLGQDGWVGMGNEKTMRPVVGHQAGAAESTLRLSVTRLFFFDRPPNGDERPLRTEPLCQVFEA